MAPLHAVRARNRERASARRNPRHPRQARGALRATSATRWARTDRLVWTRWAVAVFLVPAFGACGESETLPDAAAEARSSPLPDAAELLGGSCDPNDSDDACNLHIAVTCVDGLCTKRPDLGEPCDPERSQCRAGQVCDGGECVEVGCSLDIGEPCPGGLCSNGITCDPESLRCIEGPGLGEPCDYGCRDPYVCDHVSDTCIELLPNGSPCRSSAGCASAYCDRDYSADCEPNSCVISTCEEDCGVCSDYPSAVGCND
jgi:hypothetical protein